MEDDYLISAVNDMNAALADGNLSRKLRKSDWDKFFSAGCEGLRQLCEDEKRLGLLAANIDHPLINPDDRTKLFLREFVRRDDALMKAAGLSGRSRRRLFKHKIAVEFFLEEERDVLSMDHLTDELKAMRDDICNRAFDKKRLVLRAEAAARTLGGATIMATNAYAAPVFPLSVYSGWYGGKWIDQGIKDFRETKEPFD